MSPCEELTDRMPLVAHGRASWSPEEVAHLAHCADCAAEWTVVRAARGLGSVAAARVNPARVSAAVLARLAGERRRRRWLRGGGLVGLAAAAALTIIVVRGPDRGPELAAAGLYVPLAELEALDEGELEQVLETLDAPLTEAGSPAAPAGLGDLDDDQLERVLRSLEG